MHRSWLGVLGARRYCAAFSSTSYTSPALKDLTPSPSGGAPPLQNEAPILMSYRPTMSTTWPNVSFFRLCGRPCASLPCSFSCPALSRFSYRPWFLYLAWLKPVVLLLCSTCPVFHTALRCVRLVAFVC